MSNNARFSRQHFAALALGLFAVSTVALAEDDAENNAATEKSAAEIAQELANPNNSLGILAFPLDYVQYDGDLAGASDESAWRLSFQPSLP